MAPPPLHSFTRISQKLLKNSSLSCAEAPAACHSERSEESRSAYWISMPRTQSEIPRFARNDTAGRFFHTFSESFATAPELMAATSPHARAASWVAVSFARQGIQRRSHSRGKLALRLPKGGNPLRTPREARKLRTGFPPFGSLRASFPRE